MYEKERGMESFELLEKKVAQLISLSKKLKDENASLAKENAGLSKKLSSLESNLSKSSETAASEKEKAKLFVADIIKNIDKLVEG
jgi:cell division septum initiation protein DivIVA